MPNQKAASADAEGKFSDRHSVETTSFSEQDRLLIAKTEEAIRDGLQLEQWYREQERSLAFFPLDLRRTYRLPNKAEGFFGTLPINGALTTVMGCRQEVALGQIPVSCSGEPLREFVLGEFLKRAHWTYEDGSPGGFSFEKSIYKTAEGRYGQFPPESRKEAMDWRQLGREFSWILLTVHIHDFVLRMGPLRRRIREAAYVAPHPDFVHVVEDRSQDRVMEVSIGYPFVDVPPHPNLFGFGPGKFGVAVKLFSFFLTTKGEVRVRMVFAAAPRARKVLDFGRQIPDPVYGGAELLRYLTLGPAKPQTIRDRMDAQMLVLHCRVHQTLMDGLEKVWREWIGSHS